MATALLAAKQGYQVAGWDISEQGILKTKELAGDLASQIHPIVCDIADEKAIQNAMTETLRIGKPHMLVNNAGPVALGKTSGFLEMMDQAMKMFQYPTVAFLGTEPAQGASIVNISSVVGAVFGGGASSPSPTKEPPKIVPDAPWLTMRPYRRKLVLVSKGSYCWFHKKPGLRAKGPHQSERRRTGRT